MTVREIMTASPACCSRDTSLQDIARMMVEHDCGCIPVVENDNPIGTVTDRDICCRTVAQGRNPLELRASDCMTEGAVTVRQDASVEECVELLEQHQLRRAIVVDDQGRCCGIIAQADIARAEKHLGGEVVEAVSQPEGSSAPMH